MTVWAKDSQIIYAIIPVVAIYVVQLNWDSSIFTYLRPATLLALSLFKTGSKQSPFQVDSRRKSVLNKKLFK